MQANKQTKLSQTEKIGTVVNEERSIAEREEGVFLGSAREGMRRDDGEVVRRKEALPNGVGFGGGPENGGDQTEAARVPRRGERNDVGDASLRQDVEVIHHRLSLSSFSSFIVGFHPHYHSHEQHHAKMENPREYQINSTFGQCQVQIYTCKGKESLAFKSWHSCLRLLPKCNHEFHARCINKWLNSYSSCPKCCHNLLETCQKIVSAASSSEQFPAVVPL